MSTNAVFQWATTVLSDSLYEILPTSERFLILCELMGPHEIGVSVKDGRAYFEGSWDRMLEAQGSLLEFFSKNYYQRELPEEKEEIPDEKASKFIDAEYIIQLEESQPQNTMPSTNYDLMSTDYSQITVSRLLTEVTAEINQESIPEKQDEVQSLVKRKRTKTKENKMHRGSSLSRKSTKSLQKKYKKHRVKLNEMYCEPVEQKEAKSLLPLATTDVNEIYVDITLNSQLDDVSTLLESSGILLPLMNEAKLDDEITNFSTIEINEDPGSISEVEATLKEPFKVESKETRLMLKQADKARLKSIVKKQLEDMAPVKYFCSKCSFKSKRSSHLEKHLEYHKDNCILYACNKCSYVAIRPWILRRHKVDVHDKGGLTCPLCTYFTDKPNLLAIHTRRKHQLSENGEILPTRPAADRKELPCTEPGCSYRTTSKHLFNRHGCRHERQRRLAQAREAGSKDFICQQCGYGTWSSVRLDRHVASVHGSTRTHLCPVCGAAFKRQDSLSVHVRSHQSPERSFQCPLCPRTLRHRETLKTHLNSVHSKVRTYLCATCGAAFKTSANHRKHVVTIHENPRAFPCTLCTRKFNTKFTLERHMGKMHREINEIETNTACVETVTNHQNESTLVQASQLQDPFLPPNAVLVRESLAPPGLDGRASLMLPETAGLALLSDTDTSFCTVNSETAAALLYLGSYTSY